jgi:hypothetical protein
MFEKPCPQITEEDIDLFMYWTGTELDWDENILIAAGTKRNVIRWAEQYGVKVLAELLRQEIIKRGDDPIEAVKLLGEKIYSVKDFVLNMNKPTEEECNFFVK